MGFTVSDGIYRWEDDNMAIQFYSPMINRGGNSDFVELKKSEDIVHFYYMVEIYRKIGRYNSDTGDIVREFELLGKKWVHDYPAIVQLRDILKVIISDDVTKGGQRIDYVDGSVAFKKTYEAMNMGCDDFYEIGKTSKVGRNDIYTLYAGISNDIEDRLANVGIKVPFFNEKEARELLKCVTGFIEYAIKRHAKLLRCYRDSIQFSTGRVYKYMNGDQLVNLNIVEKIIAVGDIVDIETLDCGETEEYEDKRIASISEEGLLLSDGTKLKADDIVYISISLIEGEKTYEESKICEGFLRTLNTSEKMEFTYLDSESLFTKFRLPIIDRFGLNISSGSFEFTDEPSGEDIDNIIRGVIERIKQKLEL